MDFWGCTASIQGTFESLIEFTVNIGDLLVVGTLVLFSISFIFIKKATDENFSSGLLTMYGHAIRLIWIIPFYVWEQTENGWSDFSTSPILGGMVIFMDIFPTTLGNILWNRGIGVLGPSQSAILYKRYTSGNGDYFILYIG